MEIEQPSLKNFWLSLWLCPIINFRIHNFHLHSVKEPPTFFTRNDKFDGLSTTSSFSRQLNQRQQDSSQNTQVSIKDFSLPYEQNAKPTNSPRRSSMMLQKGDSWQANSRNSALKVNYSQQQVDSSYHGVNAPGGTSMRLQGLIQIFGKGITSGSNSRLSQKSKGESSYHHNEYGGASMANYTQTDFQKCKEPLGRGEKLMRKSSVRQSVLKQRARSETTNHNSNQMNGIVTQPDIVLPKIDGTKKIEIKSRDVAQTGFNLMPNILQFIFWLMHQFEKDKLIEEIQQKEQKYESEQSQTSQFQQTAKAMIRIRINKDRKVMSHLDQQHQNSNLLFYDFNNFKIQLQDTTGNSVANSLSTLRDVQSSQVRQRCGSRQLMNSTASTSCNTTDPELNMTSIALTTYRSLSNDQGQPIIGLSLNTTGEQDNSLLSANQQNRNCDSRRKDVGFDYSGELKRKRGNAGTKAAMRFMQAQYSNAPLSDVMGPGIENKQNNLSFFHITDCISEEAECSFDEENSCE